MTGDEHGTKWYLIRSTNSLTNGLTHKEDTELVDVGYIPGIMGACGSMRYRLFHSPS